MLVIVNRNIHKNGDTFKENLQFSSVSKEKYSFLSRVMTVDTDYIRFHKKLDSKRVKKCEKIKKKTDSILPNEFFLRNSISDSSISSLGLRNIITSQHNY